MPFSSFRASLFGVFSVAVGDLQNHDVAAAVVPKLVINNIEVLKHATVNNKLSVGGPLYHDSLSWRIIALGANERCLPVILVTSDRPLDGLHKKPKCTLSLTTLVFQKQTEDKASTFEDIVDAYIAYLQITVVNPAMDRALELLQKFAIDVHSGKISEDRLRFGAAWRHPPQIDDPKLHKEWAKLQLMDFVQSFANTGFAVNYRSDYSEEIFDDPSIVVLSQVGLLYAQRDPPFIRPISKGIQRCLVRWLVQQRMQLNSHNLMHFVWHRIIRGRYYRHLMVQIGYR
ncbi:hypothetical protein DEO72_LG9g18 [Vigna unguiculata]|uniref:Uncharacterized protein n=1 Tax=Vigna unguiculata TaxID=3917 RepID=A0A4D6MV73_VIGUN|nr:hypothetical protein DEO72_LG9g18 [Vigna unguiculata]